MAYEVLFEPMPNSETTYIKRVLEKTCDANTLIHKKAFAIITCENLLNPKLSSIIGKEKTIKPLLPIFEVSFIQLHKKSYLIKKEKKKNNTFQNFQEQIRNGESFRREIDHSDENEHCDDENDEAFINDDE